MCKIYRLENKATGVGPFQTATELLQELAHRATFVPGLALPKQDGLDLATIPFCYVFGTLTLESLQQWIMTAPSYAGNAFILAHLIEYGFELIEYEVDPCDYLIGTSASQVVFDPGPSRYNNAFRTLPLEALVPPPSLISKCPLPWTHTS